MKKTEPECLLVLKSIFRRSLKIKKPEELNWTIHDKYVEINTGFFRRNTKVDGYFIYQRKQKIDLTKCINATYCFKNGRPMSIDETFGRPNRAIRINFPNNKFYVCKHLKSSNYSMLRYIEWLNKIKH